MTDKFLDLYREKWFYVNGVLDYQDTSNNTIIWTDSDPRRDIKEQKVPEEWDSDDPNLRCVFVKWKGGNVLNLRTNQCDLQNVSYICQSKV